MAAAPARFLVLWTTGPRRKLVATRNWLRRGEREFRQGGKMTLDDLTALHAWHGTHHITQLRRRKGW